MNSVGRKTGYLTSIVLLLILFVSFFSGNQPMNTDYVVPESFEIESLQRSDAQDVDLVEIKAVNGEEVLEIDYYNSISADNVESLRKTLSGQMTPRPSSSEPYFSSPGVGTGCNRTRESIETKGRIGDISYDKYSLFATSDKVLRLCNSDKVDFRADFYMFSCSKDDLYVVRYFHQFNSRDLSIERIVSCKNTV